MPNFPIVDAHVHLYDVERLSYGWLTGVPAINRTSGLTDFDAARGDVVVDKIVFAEVAVDPGLHIEEAEFIQAMADRDPRLAGIVAHAPLEIGVRVEPDLVALKSLRNVRGLRRLIETERNPAFCLEPDFLAALRLLPKYDLTFDICIKHTAFAYALELARRCPEVSFVLDHIGKPGIKDGLMEPWKAQISELAKLPNVACKLSGVTTEADHRAWTPAQLRPYIDWVCERFGIERILYGGDWPVSQLAGDYLQWLTTLELATEDFSEGERRNLFRDNAIRIYRL